MIMVLPLTCVVSMKFQIVGKQLREVSSSWFRRAHPPAEAGNGTVTGLHYHWHCPGCGARDMSSFRICRCGRQAAQEYTATRERSKHYGFHGHFACGEKDAEATARHLATITLAGMCKAWRSSGRKKPSGSTKRAAAVSAAPTWTGGAAFWTAMSIPSVLSNLHSITGSTTPP